MPKSVIKHLTNKYNIELMDPDVILDKFLGQKSLLFLMLCIDNSQESPWREPCS